jgi:hypothetical protein
MTNQVPWSEMQSLQIPGAVGFGGKSLSIPTDWPENGLYIPPNQFSELTQFGEVQLLLKMCLDGHLGSRPAFDSIVAELDNIHLLHLLNFNVSHLKERKYHICNSPPTASLLILLSHHQSTDGGSCDL